MNDVVCKIKGNMRRNYGTINEEDLSSTVEWSSAYILFWPLVYFRTIFKMTNSLRFLALRILFSINSSITTNMTIFL